MRKNYTNISDTIDEMLTYFSRLYSEHDTKLQEREQGMYTRLILIIGKVSSVLFLFRSKKQKKKKNY